MNQTRQAMNPFPSTRDNYLGRIIDSTIIRISDESGLKLILIRAEPAFSRFFIILPVLTLAKRANVFWPNGGLDNPRTPYTGIHDSPAITFK